MMRIPRPLAAALCALVIATPLHAQAVPACEQAYAADMNKVIDSISYAYQWMDDTFSATWQSYGFNCNYNTETRQACTTASERATIAARDGQQIVLKATASGCYSCDPEYLWRVANELDNFANKLAAQRFASGGGNLLTDMLHNQVNGVVECSTPGTTTAAPPALDPGFGKGQAATDCTSVDAYSDVRLNSGFGWLLDNLTLPQCVTTCSDEATCTGYDYNTASSTCVIRSETVAQVGLESYAGWTHFECRN